MDATVTETRLSVSDPSGAAVGVWDAGVEGAMSGLGQQAARDPVFGVTATMSDSRLAATAVSDESWRVTGEREERRLDAAANGRWLSSSRREMDTEDGGAASRPGGWQELPESGNEDSEDVLSVVARGIASNGAASWGGEEGLAAAEPWRRVSDDADEQESPFSSDVESLLTELAEDIAESEAWSNRVQRRPR